MASTSSPRAAASSPIDVVELDGQVVLKIVKHCHQALPSFVTGQLLGLDIGRSLEVTRQTYYRWRREYGGMQVSQARRLRELEKENQRLRRLVADQALDNAILREAAKGN